jgi:hypothetical protein
MISHHKFQPQPKRTKELLSDSIAKGLYTAFLPTHIPRSVYVDFWWAWCTTPCGGRIEVELPSQQPSTIKKWLWSKVEWGLEMTASRGIVTSVRILKHSHLTDTTFLQARVDLRPHPQLAIKNFCTRPYQIKKGLGRRLNPTNNYSKSNHFQFSNPQSEGVVYIKLCMKSGDNIWNLYASWSSELYVTRFEKMGHLEQDKKFEILLSLWSRQWEEHNRVWIKS